MARLFNVEVFNQSFTGDSTAAPSYVSGSEFNSLLGSAESVKVQIIVDAAGTLPVTVSVAFEYNNAMQDNIWTTGTTTTVTASTFSDLPKAGYITLTAPSDLAAYGRFRVGATQNATVRIIACGWSH